MDLGPATLVGFRMDDNVKISKTHRMEATVNLTRLRTMITKTDKTDKTKADVNDKTRSDMDKLDDKVDPFQRRGSVTRSPPAPLVMQKITALTGASGNPVSPCESEDGAGISGEWRLSPAVSQQEDAEVDDESECEDECEKNNSVICMRKIGSKLRRFLLADVNRVSKHASEFIMNCMSEHEEYMLKIICKNERLQGRLDECVRHAKQVEAQRASEVSVSYASAIGRKSVNDVRETGGKSPRVNEDKNARE